MVNREKVLKITKPKPCKFCGSWIYFKIFLDGRIFPFQVADDQLHRYHLGGSIA